MLLWMLLVGWIVLLPAIVVGGLYVSSSVLGRRRAALHAYEEPFADHGGPESALEHEYPAAAATSLRPVGPSPRHASASGQTAGAATVDRQTVAAPY